MNGISFSQLHRFLALARELHFSNAAESLGIAQPMLSEQIKQLEATLGVRLFARTSRRVELTPAGAVFRDKVQFLVEALDAAVRAARDSAAGRAGRILIGHADEFNHQALPALVDHLKHAFPESLVELHLLTTPHLLEGLRTAAIDIALLCPLPEDPLGHEFRTIVLPPVPLSVAMAADHALAGQARVALIDLAGETFIEGPSEPMSGSERVVARLFAEAGIARTVGIRSMDLQLTLELVARGVGVFVGYFPEPAAAARGIRVLPLEGPAAWLTRGVAWRRNQVSALLNACGAFFQDMHHVAGKDAVPIYKKSVDEHFGNRL